MDLLEPFNRSVYQIVVVLTTVIMTAFNLSPTPINQPLSKTDIASSFNENQPQTSLYEFPKLSEVTDGVVNNAESSTIDQPAQTSAQPHSLVLGAALQSAQPTPSPKVVPTRSQTTTPLPTSSPTPQPTPRPTPSPTPEPIQIVIPTPQPTVIRSSLSANYLFGLINAIRAEHNLAAFEQDDKLCQLAKYRGPQLNDEIYGSGKIHQGLYDLNLPFWITENMASYPSEQQILNLWMNSTIHRSAILGNYKYSCGVCVGNSCAQLFTSFVPK